MPTIYDSPGDRPSLPLPDSSWMNEQTVTEALLARLDHLERSGLDAGAQFVLPFGLLSDRELIAGRIVVRRC